MLILPSVKSFSKPFIRVFLARAYSRNLLYFSFTSFTMMVIF